MSVSLDLTGKVALVTGASRGIGKAITYTLVEAGAKVIGTATSERGAAAIQEYLGVAGFGMVLNVTDSESVAALFTEIKEKTGDIDILVNNAGITKDNLLMRMKDNEWNDIIDTNLTSLFRLSKPVLRSMMKKRSGRIINIGSVVGTMGNPGQVNYCAAKAGLLGFTKSLAKEVGSRQITVNAIAPGFIQTDMTDELTEEQQKAIMSQVPMERLGQAQEIANAVLFLASDSAAYITGETLHVNGGMVMV
ncbi:MAG: 3-oxoacyl-ACP reductase FabG [Shewanella sp.]|nr:3-oxoacyl-ACP reductase FabG [Shewanella sp.]